MMRVVKATREDVLLDRVLAQKSHKHLKDCSLDENCLSFGYKDGHAWKLTKNCERLEKVTERLNNIVEKTHKAVNTRSRALISERLSYLVNTTVEDEIIVNDQYLYPMLNRAELNYSKTLLIKAFRGRLFVPRMPWIFVFDKDEREYFGKNLIDGHEVSVKQKVDKRYHHYEVVPIN